MSELTTLFLTIAGLFLLALVFYDIYATILRATKHPGPFSQLINRGSWWLISRLARNLNRRARHRILSLLGPLLMPILLVTLVSISITGFALIYLPRMGVDFRVSADTTNNAVLQSFYFSGVTLLTIGYGDILPLGFMRLVTLIEGACGIAVISLSVTYWLSIYSALERKRALALNFYHQMKQGADVAGFLSSHFSRGRFYSLSETLRDATHGLQEMLESHLEHPLIHYFHPLEVYKGLPRALFFVLETAAILNAHVDEETYVEAGDHPDILIAADNARYVLAEMLTALRLEKKALEPFETEAETLQRQKKSFIRALIHLRASKIETRSDLKQAFHEYKEDRNGWERQLYHLAGYLGYDWDEITGDRSLQDAIDDEVIERHELLISDSKEEKAEKVNIK